MGSSRRGGPGTGPLSADKVKPHSHIFAFLIAWHSPLAYDEPRRAAQRYLRNERSNHTLQSTALVYEAYIPLEKQCAAQFQKPRALLGYLRAVDAADSGRIPRVTAMPPSEAEPACDRWRGTSPDAIARLVQCVLLVPGREPSTAR